MKIKETVFCEAHFSTCINCRKRQECSLMHLKGRCQHEDFFIIHNKDGQLLSAKCQSCETKFDPDEYEEFKRN